MDFSHEISFGFSTSMIRRREKYHLRRHVIRPRCHPLKVLYLAWSIMQISSEISRPLKARQRSRGKNFAMMKMIYDFVGADFHTPNLRFEHFICIYLSPREKMAVINPEFCFGAPERPVGLKVAGTIFHKQICEDIFQWRRRRCETQVNKTIIKPLGTVVFNILWHWTLGLNDLSTKMVVTLLATTFRNAKIDHIFFFFFLSGDVMKFHQFVTATRGGEE